MICVFSTLACSQLMQFAFEHMSSRLFNIQSFRQIISFISFYFSSEYSAFWRCVKAGAAYLVTQLCKVKFTRELCVS